MWDASFDQNNIIDGRPYSDHISDIISGGNVSKCGEDIATTPTPKQSKARPVTKYPGLVIKGGGRAAGVPITDNPLRKLNMMNCLAFYSFKNRSVTEGHIRPHLKKNILLFICYLFALV